MITLTDIPGEACYFNQTYVFCLLTTGFAKHCLAFFMSFWPKHRTRNSLKRGLQTISWFKKIKNMEKLNVGLKDFQDELFLQCKPWLISTRPVLLASFQQLWAAAVSQLRRPRHYSILSSPLSLKLPPQITSLLFMSVLLGYLSPPPSLSNLLLFSFCYSYCP